jgi:hypothetical protein
LLRRSRCAQVAEVCARPASLLAAFCLASISACSGNCAETSLVIRDPAAGIDGAALLLLEIELEAVEDVFEVG